MLKIDTGTLVEPAPATSELHDMYGDGATRPLSEDALIAFLGNGHLTFGQVTDVGMMRSNNQDAAFSFFSTNRSSDEYPDFGLFVVADGMGGHQDGEKASALASQTVAAQVMSTIFMPLMAGDTENQEPISETLTAAIEKANTEVLKHVPDGGTTVTTAVIIGDLAYIAHVGDSRLYLLTKDSIEQLTRDHSLVGEMVERGELTEEEAARHPRRNIITRALGGERGVLPDLFEIDLAQGDTLLLASDGLHGMIPDSSIAEVLAGGGEPSQLCDMLVERALIAGGDDNITVALLRLDAGGTFRDIPTDPGEEPRRGKGGSGGILAGIVAVLLLAVAWMLWLRPIAERDVIPGPYDPASDTAAVRTHDSSGWIDMQEPHPAPGRDSVHPGDLLEW